MRGGTLALSIPTIAGATAYTWVGANGFSSTEQNPLIPHMTTAASGLYQVSIMVGCDTGFWGYNETMVTVTLPTISSFTSSANPVPLSGTATLTGLYVSGDTWAMTSSLGNSVNPGSGSGSGPAASAYTRNAAAGSDTITLTVTDACGNSTTRTQTIN